MIFILPNKDTDHYSISIISELELMRLLWMKICPFLFLVYSADFISFRKREKRMLFWFSLEAVYIVDRFEKRLCRRRC